MAPTHRGKGGKQGGISGAKRHQTKQIKEVISKRKIPVTGDKTINAMIDMYERKIDVMKRNYDTQLADYQLKYTRLEKEKNRQQARAEKLNTECLRLKNLL